MGSGRGPGARPARRPGAGGLPEALADAPPAQDATVAIGDGEARLTVGALTVEVNAEGLAPFLRTEDGTELLAEERAHFWWPGSRLYTAVGNGHHRLEQRFAAYEGEKLYGLGRHQHGRLDQKGLVLDLVQRNADTDGGQGSGTGRHRCQIGRAHV